MDPKANSETASSPSASEDPALEQGLFLSSPQSQTEGGAPILLQLLEFKTHLQEVVEELHIRRDAEMRFEDEISKLALEKQELEWEKESLQHQIETITKQHTESLSTVRKGFQVKLQHAEEEKGKYQVSAELKDKEINNLKEELKSLQLLKYNLEKKSSELEQKLALQSRTKENHLNQLAEVEKRFSLLSKQCALVKQAHDKLEQNVDEAMKMNSKLTTASQKQERIIVSLKKELEEVSKKLIKERMKLVAHEKTPSPSGRVQLVQELQQKLNMETEMNKKLREENVAERTEKQKLMRSLQHNQQMMLSQTQTVRRLEQELESQIVNFQALKQEQEAMRGDRKAMEDKVAELTESYAASKMSWDKERATFLHQIKSEQSDLQAMKEAYEDIQQKCSDMTLKANSQGNQTEKQEMKDSSQSPLFPTQLFFLVAEGFRAEQFPNNPNSNSELPDLGSLHHTVSSQAKIPDCLKDTGAASKLAATGASGDQDKSNSQQQMIQQISDLTRNVPETSEKPTGTCLNISDPGCVSLDGSEIPNYDANDKEDHGREDTKHETKDTEEGNETFRKEDVRSERNAGEKRTIPVETADRTDTYRVNEGSAKATEKTSTPETETRDRGEGEVTDGAKERAQTLEHAAVAAETQIPALTTADMAEASAAVQVNDFMDNELLSTVCEPLNSAESVSQKVAGNLNDTFSVNEEAHEEQQSVDAEDERHDLTGVVQTSCPEAKPMSSQLIPPCLIPGENQFGETSNDLPDRYSEISKQLNASTSLTNPALFAPEFEQNNNVEGCQTNQTETETCNPSNVDANMTQEEENTGLSVSKESGLMREPTQEVLAKEGVQLASPVADDKEDAQKRKKTQPNVNTCKNTCIPSLTSSLNNASLEVILKPDVCTGKSQEQTKPNSPKDVGDKEKPVKTDDMKLLVLRSHDNKESSETDSLQLPQMAAKEKRHEASSDLSLLNKNSFRPLFDWGTTQRTTSSSREKSDDFILQQLSQGAQTSGPDTAGHSQRKIAMFNPSRLNKVPLLFTRESDMFSAACLTSQRKESQGIKEETWRKPAAETDKRSFSVGSFPVASSSNTSSKGSWENNLECSKAASLTSAPASESDMTELSCSQERETQQSSFRAQISKIEQFLNSERLRFPKRRRTDN
ncbi:COP1-interactive protein 1-like [Cyprinodon tularosa]|uniref:COP1-interactive protein 1-like n=1 Tax=Cyprinodon tularosa TaxID=77115 RepID=UPI0018E22601|nr:COP1-interactive protein 1-like [Cyprinodon tularosa]